MTLPPWPQLGPKWRATIYREVSSSLWSGVKWEQGYSLRSDYTTQSKTLWVYLKETERGIGNRAAQNLSTQGYDVESRSHRTMGPIASGSSESELRILDKKKQAKQKKQRWRCWDMSMDDISMLLGGHCYCLILLPRARRTLGLPSLSITVVTCQMYKCYFILG